MRHTIANMLAAVLSLALAWPSVNPVFAGSPDKSRIGDEDTWAYEQFIQSYDATHALRKLRMQGSPVLNAESALTSSREMTIILLDRSTSAASAKALAYMSLLKVDGGVAEDQTCAVLRKGKPIIPYLEQAKAALKSGRCVMQEVNVKPDQSFCADAEDAMRRIESQIRAIHGGKTCMR